jgi:hypothetical protein
VLCGLAALAITTTPVLAEWVTWTGGGVDGDIADSANWGGSTPGSSDSMAFATSNNTNVLITAPVATEDIRFDANAGPFVLPDAGETNKITIVGSAFDPDPTNRIIQNNSSNTQTISSYISMAGGVIEAVTAPLVLDGVLNVGNDETTEGYNITLQGEADITLGKLTGAATEEYGDDVGGALYKDGQNRAYVTDGNPDWEGYCKIINGNLQISHNDALGHVGRTTQGWNNFTHCTTFAGGAEANGCLELAGDITCTEYLSMVARNSASKPFLRNASGNNTFDGIFEFHSGGGYWSVESAAGVLTLAPASGLIRTYNGGGTDNRCFAFRGAGDVTVQDTSIEKMRYLRKYGSGTLTLHNSTTFHGTDSMNLIIYGGTVALTGTSNLNGTANIFVRNGTTLDVSGLDPGSEFTLGLATRTDKDVYQYICGAGTVRGSTTLTDKNRIFIGGDTAWNQVGILTFDGDLNIDSSSSDATAKMVWDLAALMDDSSMGTPGTNYDLLVVQGGDLTLGPNSALQLDFGMLDAADRPTADPLNTFWQSSHEWKIIEVDVSNGGSNSGNTNFGSIIVRNGAPEDVQFSTYVGTGDDLGDIFLTCTYGSMPPIPGDTNGDRSVDATDAQVLATNWGAEVTQGDVTAGDFNDDGWVNLLDAAILAANWTGSASEGTIVPEPGVLALLLSAGIGLMLRRRR